MPAKAVEYQLGARKSFYRPAHPYPTALLRRHTRLALGDEAACIACPSWAPARYWPRSAGLPAFRRVAL